MQRLGTFAASVIGTVAAVGLLNWWMDPFADRYESAPVAYALAQPKQCLISEAVVGPEATPSFKLDLVRRRQATVVAFGGSRVGSLPALSQFERFANVSIPGENLNAVRPFFDLLRGRQRLTIYLGVEPWWFTGRPWGAPLFANDRWKRVKELLSGQTLRATIALLRRAPGAIRHPSALRAWAVEQTAAGCVVDRESAVLGGGVAAWGPDGRHYSLAELRGLPQPFGAPFDRVNGDNFNAARMDPGQVAMLADALRDARRHGWRVVGFTSPFSDAVLRRLESDPEKRGLLRDFHRRIAGLFAAAGYPYLDLMREASVPCGPDEYMYHDGGHPDAACGRRIRLRLDSIARTVR